MQAMCETVKIGIIGGDARQAALAKRLAEYGHEVAVFGLPNEFDIGRAVRCRDWRDSVRGADAVILPLPASLDGFNVNCQYGNENDKLKINTLLNFT